MVGLVFFPFTKEVDDFDDRCPEFIKGFCVKGVGRFPSGIVGSPVVVCSTCLVREAVVGFL